MKAHIILLSIFLLSLVSCTKGGFMTPDVKEFNNNSNTHIVADIESIENIDLNLLKTGATINLYVNEKNEVTASFIYPKPNTEEIVSWWFEWKYKGSQTAGVKSCNDKTLKFIAQCESYVLLYVQCTKANGMKSDIKMTSAKVCLVEKPNQLSSITN